MHFTCLQRASFLALAGTLLSMPSFKQTMFKLDPLPHEGVVTIGQPLLHSDDLCTWVYRFWIVFLKRREPPILDPVQSTNVVIHTTETGDYLLVSCLDARTAGDWMRSNAALQYTRRFDNWKAEKDWLPESTLEGPWMIACEPDTKAYLGYRVNAIHEVDTFAECLREYEEVRKQELLMSSPTHMTQALRVSRTVHYEPWETDPAVRWPLTNAFDGKQTATVADGPVFCRDLPQPEASEFEAVDDTFDFGLGAIVQALLGEYGRMLDGTKFARSYAGSRD